jgi:AcrR family transcriptional regulator
METKEFIEAQHDIVDRTDRSVQVTKGEATRERILIRAARLFNEKGYFGVSMNDLLRATGLRKGGLYNHFDSKEKLALEAFDYSLRLHRARFEQALAGKTHAADRLLAIIDVIRSSATDPPVPGGCVIMNTAIESDDALPALRERARKAMDSWRKLIRRTVEAGLESGQIQPGVSPEETASLIISSLEGGVMLSKLYRDPVHVLRAAEHMSRHVELNIRARVMKV